MHILFALPGLHRVGRGAEVAFESVAQAIAAKGEHKVTLVGSGRAREDRAYAFVHRGSAERRRFERWPKLPFLRNEFMYEEASFAASLLARGVPDADVTLTCGYPYTNWALRRLRRGGSRVPHVFVTQNGDWAPAGGRGEPRFFSCDGLVCTNPVYFERNRDRWRSALIPNGVDPARFRPGPDARAALGFPTDRPIVLMVSALDAPKRVLEAMRAVARVPDAFLVVAGDGPLRDEADRLGAEIMPGRFMRRTFPAERMPDLYRSADLFLHAKILESFGNVYIEALSGGVPIVAHDDEVTRWILRDHATLVDTTSEAALADAISETLGGPRRDLAVAAAWAHETYAWDVVARRYVSFLHEVAAG